MPFKTNRFLPNDTITTGLLAGELLLHKQLLKKC